jgi:hypothetical protein
VHRGGGLLLVLAGARPEPDVAALPELESAARVVDVRRTRGAGREVGEVRAVAETDAGPVDAAYDVWEPGAAAGVPPPPPAASACAARASSTITVTTKASNTSRRRQYTAGGCVPTG